MGRILRLTLLAPDIVDAIAHGREPTGLSLERLTKGVPVSWEGQREELYSSHRRLRSPGKPSRRSTRRT